jgi:hypothetical protein
LPAVSRVIAADPALCPVMVGLGAEEAEMDEPNPALLAVLNAFLLAHDLDLLPDGTTPRAALAAIGVDIDGFDVL